MVVHNYKSQLGEGYSFLVPSRSTNALVTNGPLGDCRTQR